jgi:hypothetical protein
MLNPETFNRLEAALTRVDMSLLELDDDRLAKMFERAAERGYASLGAYLRAEYPKLLASVKRPLLLPAA